MVEVICIFLCRRNEDDDDDYDDVDVFFNRCYEYFNGSVSGWLYTFLHARKIFPTNYTQYFNMLDLHLKVE